MKHTIFYIPGLGDSYDDYREKALKGWSVFGVAATLVPMKWYDGGTYEERFRYASGVIAEATARPGRVTVIGESAGGSMAINLFAANDRIDSLVTIAGVNTTSTPVAQRTLRRGPAFATSRQYVDESLDAISDVRKRRIHTIRAWSDNVVQPKYSQVAGAYNHSLWSVGHLSTIALCLTVLAGYIVYLAKRR